MVVRFQGNVCGTAPCRSTRLLECDRFSVNDVGLNVCALTSDSAGRRSYHAPDERMVKQPAPQHSRSAVLHFQIDVGCIRIPF